MKWQIYFMLFLMISIVGAVDDELFIARLGDEQLYVFRFGDSQLGMFFITNTTNATNASTPETPPTTGGGGTAFLNLWNYGRGAAGAYDVIVEVEDNLYRPGSEVKALITLRNTGDKPDKDTILRYYLTSPDSKKIGETQEQILEVPPITYKGQQCTYAGGTIDNRDNCVTYLEKKIYIPPDSIKGEWRFNVEYETEVQPLIRVFDVFSVMSRFDIILLIIVVSVFIHKEYKKKKK